MLHCAMLGDKMDHLNLKQYGSSTSMDALKIVPQVESDVESERCSSCF